MFNFVFRVWPNRYNTHECSVVQRFGLDFPGFKQQHIDKMWNLKNYLFQLAKKSRELFTNRSRCRAWGRIWKECSSLWQARKLGCTKLVQGRVVNEVLWKNYEWKRLTGNKSWVVRALYEPIVEQDPQSNSFLMTVEPF